jgi:Arc/MetJ-type ribon-helix-helix transcriptional regulator
MQALTLNDLTYSAPAALAEAPRAGLSKHYSFLPTSRVLEALTQDGWAIAEARQTRSKIADRSSFRKHLITLVERDVLANYGISSEVPRILLSNSHDGGAAFRLQAGLFRLVCSNGMIVSDGLIQSVAIRHSRRTIDEVVETAGAFRANSELIADHVEKFKATELSPAAAVEFVRQAIALRFSDDSDALVAMDDLLRPQRPQDVGNDLWRVFNRSQEWLLKGGFPVYRNTGKDWTERTARGIKAIDENSKLNTGLWALAEQFSLS